MLVDKKQKIIAPVSLGTGGSENVRKYTTDMQPIVTIKDILKPISSDPNVLNSEYFSHFEIRNEGSVPDIEIEMALLDSRREWLDTQRETILGADESLEFKPILHRTEGSYYILCQYKQISSQDEGNIWAQTWLPFKLKKASKEGEVYVIPGELEFILDIDKKNKIELFFNKPK